MPVPGPSQQEQCCVLRICCGAAEQQVALATKMQGWQDALSENERANLYAHLAERILANFDLVPKGAGQGIVDAYRPYFKHQP